MIRILAFCLVGLITAGCDPCYSAKTVDGEKPDTTITWLDRTQTTPAATAEAVERDRLDFPGIQPDPPGGPIDDPTPFQVRIEASPARNISNLLVTEVDEDGNEVCDIRYTSSLIMDATVHFDFQSGEDLSFATALFVEEPDTWFVKIVVEPSDCGRPFCTMLRARSRVWVVVQRHAAIRQVRLTIHQLTDEGQSREPNHDIVGTLTTVD